MKKLLIFIIILVLFGGFFIWQYLIVEEVTITTNKLEYVQGEEIIIKMRNNTLNRNIEYLGDSEGVFPLRLIGLEQFEEGEWVSPGGVPALFCGCGAICAPPRYIVLKPGESVIGTWGQNIWWCERGVANKKQVDPGKYRVTNKIPFEKKTIYSNEFIIR